MINHYSAKNFYFFIFLLICNNLLYSQNYEPIPIQSGFNADVIANGVGSAASSTNSDLDGADYAIFSRNFQLSSSSTTPLPYGLPENGSISTAINTTAGLEFQLADYNVNNSLRLSNANDSGTLTFGTPIKASVLYMLATSGSGASTVDIAVNFSDATTQNFSGVGISDWYGSPDYAIQGIGRINRSNNTIETGSGTNPRLYQIPLTIDPANLSKIINSVTITKNGTGGVSNIFAFSGDLYNSCTEPTNISVTAGMNSVTVSWTASSINPVGGYDYYVSTSGIRPVATTPPTGNIAGTVLTLNSLTEGENYYLWIRSNCGSGSLGFWKKKQFTTSQIYAVYNNGDISTMYSTNVTPSSTNTCPGTLSIVVPAGYKIKNTSVSYSMSTAGNGWMAEQRSILACLTDGTIENNVGSGLGSYTGTFTYNRTNVNIGIGLTGTVNYELRAFRTYGGSDCNTAYNKVDNNTWKVTVTLEPVINLGNEDFNKVEFTTYPNPFTDVLTISSVENVAEISVSDVLGRMHKKIKNPSKALELHDLEKGLYLITLKMLDGSHKTIKALKQ